jgi:hypothetical protein
MERTVMYYSRTLWSRRIQHAVAALGLTLLQCAVPTARAQAPDADVLDAADRSLRELALPAAIRPAVDLAIRNLEVRRDALGPDSPLALRFFLKPDAPDKAQRIVDTTREAVRRFTAWFGPLPWPSLTVIDAPWQSEIAGTSLPGLAVVSSGWLTPASDLTLERDIIAAVARQYFLARTPGSESEPWLGEGLARYAAARGIDRGLEGRHFATLHYFGGSVPYTVRSLAMSRRQTDPRPSIVHFARREDPVAPAAGFAADPVQRTVRALYTLERHLGWPAWQQALETFVRRSSERPATLAQLAEIVAEQRGTDLAWLFDAAFHPSSDVDYGVESMSSAPSPAQGDRFDTVVSLRRYSATEPTGGARTGRNPLDRADALPVVVTFADGNAMTDWWDGREDRSELRYVSRARALQAVVDPEVTLVLDRDRSNNARTLEPMLTATYVRLAMSWMIWLQDLALTCTALI